MLQKKLIFYYYVRLFEIHIQTFYYMHYLFVRLVMIIFNYKYYYYLHSKFLYFLLI